MENHTGAAPTVHTEGYPLKYDQTYPDLEQRLLVVAKSVGHDAARWVNQRPADTSESEDSDDSAADSEDKQGSSRC